MNAPGNTQAHVRAADERRRAARTAEIAERHEESIDSEPFLQAFHLRMATIHRQVQRQHLAAAALHAARAADRGRPWSDVTSGCSWPGLSAAGEDQPPVPRAPDRYRDGVTVRPGHRRRRPALVRRGSRVKPRTLAVAAPRLQGLPARGGKAHTVLVTLVESLEINADGSSFLSGFIARCVALLNVTAAAMLMANHRGTLGIASWSSEAARLFTSAELSKGAGPSVECHLTGGHCAYPTASALATHWPHLAETAKAAHIAAVYAVPLRRRDTAFGVLTLLDRRPGRPTNETLQLVSLLAAAGAVGLANQRTFDDHLRIAAQLQSALTSRIAIEQAKGMLAERLGIPADAAFDLLRGHARANNRNLHEVAATIIDRSLRIAHRGSDRTAPLPRTTPPRER